jgi:hypothetical protein
VLAPGAANEAEHAIGVVLDEALRIATERMPLAAVVVALDPFDDAPAPQELGPVGDFHLDILSVIMNSWPRRRK